MTEIKIKEVKTDITRIHLNQVYGMHNCNEINAYMQEIVEVLNKKYEYTFNVDNLFHMFYEEFEEKVFEIDSKLDLVGCVHNDDDHPYLDIYRVAYKVNIEEV